MSTNNTQKAGIYFGEERGFISAARKLFGTDISVVKPICADGNVAVFGGVGSGKSTGIVLPTLCQTWTGNFLAIDIKSELATVYGQKKPGNSAKVFSLRGETSYTYDPFEFIRYDGDDNLVSNIRELVNALIPLPLDTKDPIWIQSARELLTGYLLYFYGIGTNFVESVINIMSTSASEQISQIATSKNEAAKIFVNNFYNKGDDSDLRFVKYVCQEITNRLSIIATDGRVCNALVPSDRQIRWTDLETGNIFISVPEDRLEQYAPVITMMLTQLIRTLERRPEKYSPEGIKKIPVLLMLDEFPRLGRNDAIVAATTTLRSKKVSICFVCQSLAQLDLIYGQNVRRILLDNCAYKAVLSVGDVESQRYFSDLAGMKIVEHRSRSTYYDTDKNVTGYSENVSHSREPIIRPHEFATQKDIVLFNPDGVSFVKKTSSYKVEIITKIRDGAKKLFGKIKGFFSRR